MGTLDGLVAIVTGSSSGIGRATAITLAAAGAAVAVNYPFVDNRPAGEAVRGTIEQAGGRAIAVQADVSKAVELQRLVDQTVATFGRLDLMVNNAGIESGTSILDTTEQDFDRVIGVNLRGAFFGTQFAAKQMIEQGTGGRIINISSVHEDWPMPRNAPYCCSKGGMRMLTRTAGVELAPHGITVVGVGPGAVDTPINAADLSDPTARTRLNQTIPLGRVAQPEEVARLVLWLASEHNTYVTATTFFVDGGIMQYGPGL
ncbi:MAG: SDR family NAD(P)-dependent oxidoreductase [Dehalococcoidia bacterium]